MRAIFNLKDVWVFLRDKCRDLDKSFTVREVEGQWNLSLLPGVRLPGKRLAAPTGKQQAWYKNGKPRFILITEYTKDFEQNLWLQIFITMHVNIVKPQTTFAL